MNTNGIDKEGSLATLWNRFEPSIFWIVLLLNLIPVLGVSYFFTGDGPAHLYNSNIIANLLGGSNSIFHEFFVLRYELIPNLGGHVLLSALNSFLPAAIAEKVIYLSCLILLPLGFRYALKQFNTSFSPLLCLIFPLAHNFCFYIGFQSFSLSLALMFFTIGLAQKAYIERKIRLIILWGLMLFATALFHLFPAVIAMMALGIYFLIHTIKENFKNIKELLIFVLLGMPAVIFSLHFILGNSEGLQFNQTEISQLLKGLWLALPLVTIDTLETSYSIAFNVIFGLALVLTFYERFKKGLVLQTNDFALLAGVLVLILYFLLPDKMATGGFLTMRLLLCCYLLMGLWVSLNSRFSILTLILGLAFITVNLVKLPYQLTKAKELSADAVAISEALDYIPEGSTLLPLNYSYHWLHYNIGLYLGAEKEIVVLDNYEASTTHFPVIWKEEVFPGELLGDFGKSNRPKLLIEPYEEFSGQRVDAIVRWKHSFDLTDEATLYTDSILEFLFYPEFTSEDGSVEVHLRKKLEVNSNFGINKSTN